MRCRIPDAGIGALNGSAEIAPELTKLAFSIREFGEAVGIGRTLTYSEIAAGRLVAVRCGRRTLIRVADAQRWLANLPAAAADEPAAPRQARLKRQRGDQYRPGDRKQRIGPQSAPDPIGSISARTSS